MIRTASLVVLVGLLASLAAGCSSGSTTPASDFVTRVPWTTDETLTYRLVDRAGKEIGSATLTVDLRDGETELIQRFSSGANTDDVSVMVESRSLKPISSKRVIASATNREELEVTYSEAGALIRQGDKQSGLTVPEHAYDNDTSLFIWRTLAFAEGFKARYITVITNRRSRQDVELHVLGRETVTVPAGRFSAWRLEIRSSNAKQTAWYADSASMPLLRYDNDRGVIFELTSRPASLAP